MDIVDKKIFLKNFNGLLTPRDLVGELDRVSSAILYENDYYETEPTVNKKNIQKLKQVLWILEENNKGE